MTSERIKEIQQKTAYPESVSVMLALNQVWNECEQENSKKISSKPMLLGEIELLKKFWEYIDKESVAINCDNKERDEVIGDFFSLFAQQS